MASEIENANDPLFIFSFTELFKSQEKKSYLTSMRAMVDRINKNVIFDMTYLDITSTVIDDSTGKPLIKILDYVSRETRFVNYISLLFKDTDLIDADGNYSVDNDGNINLQNSIKNNEYFSNRFDLLPESYTFSFNEDKNSKYIIMEGAPQWNNKMPYDVWSDDNNVQIVIDLILEQRKILYNDRENSVFSVNYRWRGGRKISFINTIKVGDTTIWLGSGFDLNSLLDQSMIIKGDNTLTGNFYVNDTNNNNIFKVDNLNKTITNTYKVGIGMEEPKSILDVKDTTIHDILSHNDAAYQEWNILNKIASKMREVGNNPYSHSIDCTDFKKIIDEVYIEFNIEQTIDNYARLYKLDMDTMLVDDIDVLSHWLYPTWNGKKLGELHDDVNQFGLKVAKEETFFDLLNNKMIYDNYTATSTQKYVFGRRFLRMLMVEIKGKMYVLLLHTNIQGFGLRPDSNTNISRLITNFTHRTMMINHIYSLMKVITPVNKVEGFNTLTILNNKNQDIKISNFILSIDINDISNITYQEVILDDNTLNLNMGKVIKLNDTDEYNMISKYKNFWITFNKKNYSKYMSNNDFNVVTYEDLYYDYIAGIKCIEISGNKYTLLCSETRIQEIIKPSVSVEGDTKITGDLIIAKKSSDENFVSIDPDNHYIGVGTDERFINYQDRIYNTTDSIYAGRHNVYINHTKYPVMVVERIRELPEEKLSNYRSFRSYSTLTAKRKSLMYDFNDIYKYAKEYEKDFRSRAEDDNVSHMKYGPDISFEVCDKTDRTVELGQIGMNIDSMNDEGYLRGGFGIHVFDPKQKSKPTVPTKRSILYVDNDSQLFVKTINLNGGVLENKNGDLHWNGKKLATVD